MTKDLKMEIICDIVKLWKCRKGSKEVELRGRKEVTMNYKKDENRRLSDDDGFSDLPMTRAELLPLLQQLQEKAVFVDEEIADLARESRRVLAELEAIEEKLSNLKEYY